MTDVTIYHNPRCSKSRGALEILRERGLEPEVVEYLKRPLASGQIERLIALLPDAPGDLVRRDERFAELGLDAGALESAAAVVRVLQDHPELMQRPIVVRGHKAVIARPPEKLLDVL